MNLNNLSLSLCYLVIPFEPSSASIRLWKPACMCFGEPMFGPGLWKGAKTLRMRLDKAKHSLKLSDYCVCVQLWVNSAPSGGYVPLTQLIIQSWKHWAIWLPLIVHFEFPIGQPQNVDYFNCFGCTDPKCFHFCLMRSPYSLFRPISIHAVVCFQLPPKRH